jgi:DNA-binding transcriptional LysR family regulator
MELRQFRYLVVLAEELHFSRAAQRLGIAQPALTQPIQVLERELGAKLFQRTKRSVHLTVAGRLTLEQALQTLQQAERTAVVARQAGRGEKGYVEIGYVGSAAFSGILSKTIFAYRKTNPDIELRLHELDITQQVDDVDSGRLDVGFIRPPVRQWPVGVTSLTLSRESIIVAVPKSHRLARLKAVPIAALANEPFIVTHFQEGVGFHAQVAAMCREGHASHRSARAAVRCDYQSRRRRAGSGVRPGFAPQRSASQRRLSAPGGCQGDDRSGDVFCKSEQAPAVVSFIDKVKRSVQAR